MKKEDLKCGMTIHSKTLNVDYVVINAKGDILIQPKNGGVVTMLPKALLSDWEITNPRLERVFVVTTQVLQGEEFPAQLYYGVFESESKARKYFQSERNAWIQSMTNRYCYENDLVGIYTCNDNRIEIFGDDERKDVVIIELKEKQIQ